MSSSPSLLSANAEQTAACWLYARALMHQQSSSSLSLRSTPIAIVRKSPVDSLHEDSDDDDDSSEESSTFDVDEECSSRLLVGSLPRRSPHLSRNRRRRWHKKSSQSLPSTPRLAALDGPQFRMDELNIPPMALTEAMEEPTVETTSYGSLRESYLAGRFLDGPSSYREKGSGQIRLLSRDLSRNVHFSASLPRTDSPSMGSWSRRRTPGERMASLRIQQDQQQEEQEEEKQQDKEDEQTRDEETERLQSSLSSLLLSSSPQQEEQNHVMTPTLVWHSPRASTGNNAETYHHPDEYEEEDVFLSVSLTGLEVLQQNFSLGDTHLDAVLEEDTHRLLLSGGVVLPPPGASAEQHPPPLIASSLPVEYHPHVMDHGEEEAHHDHAAGCFDLDME